MTYDPNMNSGRPDLRSPRPPSGGNWIWAALGAVAIFGVVLWVTMSGPTTDATTTSSTSQPAATETAPVIDPVDPASPAAPPADDMAPVTPETGTANP